MQSFNADGAALHWGSAQTTVCMCPFLLHALRLGGMRARRVVGSALGFCMQAGMLVVRHASAWVLCSIVSGAGGR